MVGLTGQRPTTGLALLMVARRFFVPLNIHGELENVRRVAILPGGV
jgi:hypothetical protein